MLNFGPTFIWVAINLMILYFFLRKFLFKPVTQFMEKRTMSIKNAIESAEANRSESETLRLKYTEQLRAARDDADKILNDARIRADKEYEAIINNARQNVEDINAKAREELELERQQVTRDIKNQVAGLALAAASKVLEANMDTESNRKLVDDFLDKAGAA
jgi:F-type H+-transporting ATPase subunit b